MIYKVERRGSPGAVFSGEPVESLVSHSLANKYFITQSISLPFGKEQILETNFITYRCKHNVENRPR